MEILRTLSGIIALYLLSISTIIGKGEHLPLIQSEVLTYTSAETIQVELHNIIGDYSIFNHQANTFTKRVINHFAFSSLVNKTFLKNPAIQQPYDALYHIDVYRGSMSILNLVLRI